MVGIITGVGVQYRQYTGTSIVLDYKEKKNYVAVVLKSNAVSLNFAVKQNFICPKYFIVLI